MTPCYTANFVAPEVGGEKAFEGLGVCLGGFGGLEDFGVLFGLRESRVLDWFGNLLVYKVDDWWFMWGFEEFQRVGARGGEGGEGVRGVGWWGG